MNRLSLREPDRKLSARHAAQAIAGQFPAVDVGDADSGDLAGVIDWTDAALADPALDFTVLLARRGPEFVEEVLRHYPRPFDAAARERLAFLARVQSLDWLHDAERDGGDVAKHVGWVANAFAPFTGGSAA